MCQLSVNYEESLENMTFIREVLGFQRAVKYSGRCDRCEVC